MTATSDTGAGQIPEGCDEAAPTRARVAAVQVEARVGDIAHNLRHAEALAIEALENGAKIVALPEFFTGRVIFDVRVWDTVLPGHSNVALEMLCSLARRYRAYVGGSMLLAEDGDIHNTYCLAAPDGRVRKHQKDIPTMWEHAFYTGGNDDGVVDTIYGDAGVAVCWELVRQRTIRRFAGRIRFAITGNQWWSTARNWYGTRFFAAVEQYNRYLSENAPAELARLLRVPVLHASHCGSFAARMLLTPWSDASVPYVSEFVGATQIVDAAGHVLAARNACEGPGVVAAEIEICGPAAPAPVTSRFWVPHLTLLHKLFWHHQNACGRAYYRRAVAQRLQRPGTSA